MIYDGIMELYFLVGKSGIILTAGGSSAVDGIYDSSHYMNAAA